MILLNIIVQIFTKRNIFIKNSNQNFIYNLRILIKIIYLSLYNKNLKMQLEKNMYIFLKDIIKILNNNL